MSSEVEVIQEDEFFTRLKEIIFQYKSDFSRIDQEERYKWHAIETFQKNWNIDAEDFTDMLIKSLSKAHNLLNAQMYFPAGMIIEMARRDATTIRDMFVNLFDEDQPVLERISTFKKRAEEIKESYSDWTGKNSYQNENAITVYLFFRYPEKYYIYKSTKFRKAANVLGYNNIPKRGSIESVKAYYDMADMIWSVIKNNQELLKINHERLGQDDYKDDLNHVLAEDIILYASRIEEEKSDDIEYGANVLLYGVPGAGKSYTIQNKYCDDPAYIERVVFHPEYTYSDFIGQILPRIEDDSLEYVFTPGPFTNSLRRAYQDPENMYYLIIEEINRGNAPAIFGEIFQLLDRKEEGIFPEEEVGESEYGISNFDIASEVYGDENHKVIIPRNLTILATMNTADQNVFTLDTAFQRRWDMKQIENNVMGANHAGVYIDDNEITWGAFATITNQVILDESFGVMSSEDKRLGAYFVKKKEFSRKRFAEKVLKYLWDDAFKMNHEAYFNASIKSIDDLFRIYIDGMNPLSLVLKKDVYDRMKSFILMQVTDNKVGE